MISEQKRSFTLKGTKRAGVLYHYAPLQVMPVLLL